MKKIILGITMVLLVFTACKKNKKFEVVTDEVYTINEITRGGCFDYDPTDTTDTTAIIPVTVMGSRMYIKNEFAMVEFSANYFCLANDSIDLKGNVLSFFLKPSDDSNTDCNCDYSWIIKLNIIKNTGMKLIYFEYVNDKYVQKQEMYTDLLY